MLDTNEDFGQLLEDVDFDFPTNVKQIGSISKGLKIYIEDYAFTYINKFAHTNSYSERIGALVGKPFVKDGELILLIVGAISCKFSKQLNGTETFSEDDWEHIETQMRSFFSDYEIVGWLHSQPGYGVFLNTSDANLHREYFPQKYNVLFLIDTTEKIDSFFAWDKSGEQLNEISGYFVYYEKNLPMQEYMLANKEVVAKPVEHSSPGFENEGEDVAQLYRRQERIKKETVSSQKRLQNMLATISVLLFFVSLIMGVSLIQNSDRITSLEEQLNTVSELYTNFVAQATNQNTTSVFAEESPNNTETNAETNAAEQADSNIESETSGNTQIIFETQPQQNEENTVAQPENTPATAVEPEPVATEPLEEVVAEKPTEEQKPVTQTPVAQTPVAQTPVIPEYYIVEDGDNLSYISYKFYGSSNMSAKIMELNEIDNPDTIYYGKKLYLPQN